MVEDAALDAKPLGGEGLAEPLTLPGAVAAVWEPPLAHPAAATRDTAPMTAAAKAWPPEWWRTILYPPFEVESGLVRFEPSD